MQIIKESMSYANIQVQVELHAYLQQPGLRSLCEKHGITITAYYPLGGQSREHYPKDWQ